MIGGIGIARRTSPKGGKPKTRPTKKKQRANLAVHRGSASPKGFTLDASLSKSIIDHSPITISILNKDGIILYTNPSVKQVYGSSKKNAENRSFFRNIHPKDIPRIKKTFKASLKGKGAEIDVLPVMLKDGSYRYLKVVNKAIKDASGNALYVSYYSDITDHVESDKALKDSEKRYRILADTAQDMIFIVNNDMMVEYVNEASAKEFHKKSKEIVGKPLRNFFPSFIYKRQEGSLRQVFKTGKPFYTANDTIFPSGQKLLDTWLVPIKDDSGKVRSVFGISRDTTNYKRMSNELKLREAEAEEAKIRAQTYLDFLAHDVANLISPIMTYSDELAKEGLDDKDALIHLKKMHEMTQRTARLIIDIRMLVEAEKCPQCTNERFNLGEFFIGLQQTVNKQFPGRCEIVLELPKGKTMEVVGGIHIKNAFMQGFSNSMDVHSDTCINVHVKILLIKKGKRPFWQVRMDMPDRPADSTWKDRIIPPFDPSRRSLGRSIDSLAFSSAIIQHFGGSMRVEHINRDDPSKGHTVVIELPKAGTWHNARNT